MISRRAFLAGASAMLATTPRTIWAQNSQKRRLAIAHVSRPVDQFTATGHPMYVAFHDELTQHGYVDQVVDDISHLMDQESFLAQGAYHD